MKKKYNIEFTDEAFDELESLKAASGSMANVVRNALKVYKFLKDEEKEGGRLIVESKKGDRRQIIVP